MCLSGWIRGQKCFIRTRVKRVEIVNVMMFQRRGMVVELSVSFSPTSLCPATPPRDL